MRWLLLGCGILLAGCGPGNEGPPTDLVSAARAGAVDRLAALLDAGADVNSVDRTRSAWTPLHHAIHKQQIAAVRLLLERGANPNAHAGDGTLTPLLMAATESDPAFVEELLAYGADARYVGEYGETPLTRAVSGGALADMDRPLFGHCHAATVRTLLAYDPTLRLPASSNGRRALWWARVHTCKDVLNLLGERQLGPPGLIISAAGIAREELGSLIPRRGP